MSLALVERSARAVSEHLNRYFRVLKGVDPDSVILRLPGPLNSGSFEVRHSATNLPILKVTDAGLDATIGTTDIADGSITTAKLADNAVTGAKIVDGTIGAPDIAAGQIDTLRLANKAVTSAKIDDLTIVGANIANATIPSSKLITGAPITPDSITFAEIADGTVRTQELAANAVTTRLAAIAGATNPTTNSVGVVSLADPAATVVLAQGGDILAWMTSEYSDSAGGGVIVSYYLILTTQSAVVVAELAQATNQGRSYASGFHIWRGLPAGTYTATIAASNNSPSTITHFAAGRRLMAIGVYR